MKKNGNSDRFYFLGSKITADNDCNDEIKRHFLAPWNKSYEKLGQQIKKSKDVTLPTKFPLVKAMVFPVVMHECESWTIKKAEH